MTFVLLLTSFDTSPFPFGSRDSSPSKPLMDFLKSSCSLLYMRAAHHGSPSQSPPLHHFSSLMNMNIVNALKQTKSMKKSKLDLMSFDFDNIEVQDVKYLSFFFDGDVLFGLTIGTWRSKCLWLFDEWYGQDVRWTLLVHHQTTYIQNDFGFSFKRSTCVGHLQCSNEFYDYMHRNAGKCNNTECVISTRTPFSMDVVALEKFQIGI